MLFRFKIGVNGLLLEFEEIKKFTQPIGTTAKTAFDTHSEKNRYKGKSTSL